MSESIPNPASTDSTASAVPTALARTDYRRVIGSVDCGQPGPLVIAIGGMHGNEAEGVIAAERVLAVLAGHDLELRGRFLALGGNLGALNRGERFQAFDLNRAWNEAGMERVANGDEAPEVREQRELLTHLRRAIDEHGDRGEAVLLDLHSSSALGAPFSCMGDTIKNRRIALALPIPLILGLEEIIDGSLLEFLGDRGHVCVAVEGGQHRDPATVDHHEAVLWIALASSGALDPRRIPDFSEAYRTLKDAGRGSPGVVEVLYRHHVAPTDGFRMEPGHKNFEWVRRGQLLARELHGEVRASMDGVLLLPLYQAQGEDGFFLGREVRRFWLRLSAICRRLRLGRLLPWLPGVRRHPQREDTLLVDQRVARWLARDVFHLFGFRQCRHEGELLVFTRRRESAPLPL